MPMAAAGRQQSRAGAISDTVSSSGPWRLLAGADFRQVWLIGICTGVIRWLEFLAVGIYVFEQTGSPLIVALITVVRLLPLSLFGAFTGAIAERVDRRRLLLGGLVVMTAVQTVLLGLALTGLISLWHVAIGAFASGIFWSGENSVRRTMLAEFAGFANLGASIGFDMATNNAMRMVGPLLGGVVIAVLGLAGVYGLGMVLFAVGAGLCARVRYETQLPPSSVRGVIANIREGLAHIRGQPLIVGTLVVTVFVNLWGFAYTPMVPVVGKDVLLAGPVAVGFLAAIEGLGALLASLAIAVWARPHYFTRIYMCGSILFLVAILAFAQAPGYSLALVALFLGGIGVAGFSTMQSAILLAAAAPDMRARVMGALTVCIGAGPLGFFHVGLLASWLGPVAALSVMALEGLVAIGIALLLWPTLRRTADPYAGNTR